MGRPKRVVGQVASTGEPVYCWSWGPLCLVRKAGRPRWIQATVWCNGIQLGPLPQVRMLRLRRDLQVEERLLEAIFGPRSKATDER